MAVRPALSSSVTRPLTTDIAIRPLARTLDDRVAITPLRCPGKQHPPVPSPDVPPGRADIPAVPDYEILTLAGRGAFGSVWVARDRSGVLRALKVIDLDRLPEHSAGDQEEQALSLVRQRLPRHPHIVEIFHITRQDGRLVYAMELADAAQESSPPGEDGYRADTLAQRIASHGRLPAREAIGIALDLLSALEALHSAKLVHRDVKPANVIFVGGIPKLADIGLAAVAQTSMSLAGTPGFLPLDGSTGPDADLFALGKLIYQAVTGLAPSEFPSVPADVLSGADTELVRRLNRVLLRACAPAKADRFRSAAELRAALEDALHPPRFSARQLAWSAAAVFTAAVALWLAVAGPRSSTLDAIPVEPGTPLVSVNDVLASLTADPVDDAFINAVAALPAADQVRVVAAKLQKLNPGFDGKMDREHQGRPVRIIEDDKVVGLSFSTAQAPDISPLRALPHLRELHCGARRTGGSHGGLADLAPLRGLKLTTLWFDWSLVEDLSPLEGMPLTNLGCMGNRITDLSPCRGMPLVELYCHSNTIRDLTPLQGAPLRHLNCGANPITTWDAIRNMELESLTAFDTDLADLSILAKSPLTMLYVQKTKVTDLAPLRGKPLRMLNCGGNRIGSLEPLHGMPLEMLFVWETDVSDLEPLRGMKLRELALNVSPVRDLSPLAGMPLRVLHYDVNLPRDREVLRSMKSLQRVNDRSAHELLK